MFIGSKSGCCVGLTNLPFSCADCLQILDPGTLRSSPALYRDCFTFTCNLNNLYYVKWESDSWILVISWFKIFWISYKPLDSLKASNQVHLATINQNVVIPAAMQPMVQLICTVTVAVQTETAEISGHTAC
jgi:hypothetical protein